KCKVFYTFPIKSLHFIFDKSGQNPCQIWNFCLFSKPYVDTKVNPDYEKMVRIGEQYEHDAEFLDRMSLEIAQASNDMANAIEEVNKAIQHVSSTSQQSAAGTEEMSFNISEVSLAMKETAEMVDHQHQLAHKINESLQKFSL
ncbi:hypothetical protein ABER67_15830, partial [Heyndrickxia faecalis]